MVWNPNMIGCLVERKKMSLWAFQARQTDQMIEQQETEKQKKKKKKKERQKMMKSEYLGLAEGQTCQQRRKSLSISRCTSSSGLGAHTAELVARDWLPISASHQTEKE